VVIEDGAIVDRNPATGEEIARVPVATPAEIEAAVATAKAAQRAWSAVPLKERCELLKQGCKAISKDVDALAAMMTAEMGKVISESKEELEGAANKDEMIDLVAAANADEVVGEAGGAQSLIVRDALGVVVVLSPWNFPADEILLLTVPALAAGNAVIVKPSEVAPLTGKQVVAALESVLPPGVVQVLQGDGGVGAALVASPIQMVAMTGSSAVGKKIMASCSGDLKRLVLELGGKDPMVVFADADLDKAAEDAVKFSLYNCGQVCCSVERVYIDASVAEPFAEKVCKIAASYTVGPGADEASKVGPMVSAMQKEMVENQVKDAVEAGAKLLYKSDVPNVSENYYPVTVLGDVAQDLKIMRNETFGPVVSMTPFDGSEEAAVTLANDTEYGLAAYVYTGDVAGKGKRVAMGIKAGQVGINCYSPFCAHTQCPWAGQKGSGHGYHSGYDGWRQFSAPKSLVFEGSVPTAGS